MFCGIGEYNLVMLLLVFGGVVLYPVFWFAVANSSINVEVFTPHWDPK